MEIVVFVSVILIAFGLANLYKPFIEWYIKFRNEARGTKAEVTETAIMWCRFCGIISIISGVTLLFVQIFLN